MKVMSALPAFRNTINNCEYFKDLEDLHNMAGPPRRIGLRDVEAPSVARRKYYINRLLLPNVSNSVGIVTTV
jgi:hypothetical protein